MGSERREVALRERIFSSLPFVHLPATSRRSTLCWHCLLPSSTSLTLDHMHLTTLTSTCCSLVRYCSATCRSSDLLHPLECSYLAQLSLLTDLAHVTARLLLLVAGEQGRVGEELPFNQGTRGFWDLLSHADKIPEDDYWSAKIYQQLCEVLPKEVVGDWSYFTEVGEPHYPTPGSSGAWKAPGQQLRGEQ